MHFRDSSDQTLAEVFECKLVELQAQFIEMYGESGNEMWENLLRRNT